MLVALGRHPRHLHAVPTGELSEAAPLGADETACRLVAVGTRLRSIAERLDDLHASLAKGTDHDRAE